MIEQQVPRVPLNIQADKVVERLRCLAMQSYWAAATPRMRAHTFVASCGIAAENVEIVCDSANTMEEMDLSTPWLLERMRRFGGELVRDLVLSVGDVGGVAYNGPDCICGQCSP